MIRPKIATEVPIMAKRGSEAKLIKIPTILTPAASNKRFIRFLKESTISPEKKILRKMDMEIEIPIGDTKLKGLKVMKVTIK